MIGYFDFGKDVGRLLVVWQMFKFQEELVKVVKQYGVYLIMFYGCGGIVGRGGGFIYLVIFLQLLDIVNGLL